MGHQQTGKKNTNKQEKTPTNKPNKGKTFPNKEKHQQTRKKTPTNEGKTFPNKGNLSKRGKTFPNKGNASKQGKRLSNKRNTFQARNRLSSRGGYLPIKCKSSRVVGVSRQGKAVVSDGGYGVIGR